MKKLIVLVILALSFSAHSCPEKSDFPIDIKITEEAQTDNHIPLKAISMSLLLEHKGLNLVAIQLLYGEVSEFVIPLEYGKDRGKAHTRFSISQRYMSSLEVLYIYSGSGCNVAVQKLVNT
ncbi:hypothetical protein NBRC116493_23180 [Aurantivibrio infirmus]